MKLLGIGLIILGVLALVYQGVSFFIPKETIDLSFLSITVYQQHTVPLPPIVGGISLIAGIVLVMMGGRE